MVNCDIYFTYGLATGLMFCVVLLFFMLPGIRRQKKQSDQLDEIIKRLKKDE